MKNIHLQPRGLSPSRQAYRSLSNGRSSQAFAIAAAVSSLAAYSEMPDRLRRSVVASAHALAATTALIRVAGGQENLRDALIGAAIGSAIGFVIPHLHRSRGGDHQVLASMRVRPAVFDGGVGINTSLRF